MELDFHKINSFGWYFCTFVFCLHKNFLVYIFHMPLHLLLFKWVMFYLGLSKTLRLVLHNKRPNSFVGILVRLQHPWWLWCEKEKFYIFEMKFVFQTFHESYILQIVTLHWHMVFVSWVSLNVMKVHFLAYNFNEKKKKIINLTKPIEFWR